MSEQSTQDYQNLIDQLSIQGIKIQAYQEFLTEVIKAVANDQEPRIISSILKRHQDKLDSIFAQLFPGYIRYWFSQINAKKVASVAQVIFNLSLHIQSFLWGNRGNNINIAIIGYETLLDVINRGNFPYLWAMIQISLGSSFSHRLYGARAENLELSIAAYKNALSIFTRDTFPKQWSDVQNDLGTIYQKRVRGKKAENLELAIACYHKSLEVCTYELFPYEWGETQNNLGVIYRERIKGNRAENLELAIAAFQASLKVYTRQTFPEKWARLQNNLAIAYEQRIQGNRANNIELAIAIYQKSLTILTRETFPYYWADVHNNLGVSYTNRIIGDKAENLELAIAAFQDTLTVFQRESFPENWARSYNNLGTAYSDRIRGERAENLELAIECYVKSLEVYTREAFPDKWAMTLNHVALTYQQRIRGEKAENLELAIFIYQTSLEVYTREAFPENWADTHNNLGIAYKQRIVGDKQDNLALAIAAYKNALNILTRDAFPEKWARLQNNLGNAYRDRFCINKQENLKLAIVAYEKSLEVYTRETFPEEWARSWNNLGLVYGELHQIPEAIKAFRLSLTIYTPAAFPLECLQAGRGLGHTAKINKDWKTTIEGFQIAIEAVENTRLEALNPQSRQEVLSNAIDVFYGIVKAYFNLNQFDKALEYIERSKTRNLVELMAQKKLQPQGIDQTTINQLNKLHRRVINEQIRLQNQAIQRNFLENNNLAPYITNYSHLQEYQQVLDNFIEEKITPVDATFKLTQKVQPITFSDIKSLTDHQTCLLQWYITRTTILAFVVSADSKVKVWESSEEDRNKFFENITNYLELYYSEDARQEWIDQLPVFLEKFSDNLKINQIIDLISHHCQHLIIIPHCLLHILPFHALPIDNHRILQDKYNIQYAPSCQLLKITKQRQLNQLTNLFAIQNPTKDLIYADLEVNILSTLFNQRAILAKDQATKEIVTQHLTTANSHYYHFSCHGQFNFSNPLDATLLLAARETLTLGEIFKLNLKKSRLVVLSACETGFIDIKSISDEYIGLPGGFLFAGTPSVVSSLWTVSDLSTSLLMIKFYEILLNKNQVISVPIALKTAQNWLRNLTAKEFEKILTSFIFQQALNQLQANLSIGDFFELEDAMTMTRNKVQKLLPDDKPFENPFYWAAFTATGI